MDLYDYDIPMLIKMLGQCFKKDLDEKLKEYDLTATQGRIIFFINYKESIQEKVASKDIIERYSLSKSTVSELLSRLEGKDLVKKVAEGNKVYLYLTDYSRSLIDKFEKSVETSKQQLIADLSEDDIKVTKECLINMIKNMKGEEEICGNK